jgi:hypothetical protein
MISDFKENELRTGIDLLAENCPEGMAIREAATCNALNDQLD